jgi:arginine/ornithine N-succinyltransferase beta subunit
VRLYRDLLPDREQVLGHRHPDTQTTRANIAFWTGQGGDTSGALRLYRDLLPDMEQVLGHRHPDTLTTRANIARWAGESGDDR